MMTTFTNKYKNPCLIDRVDRPVLTGSSPLGCPKQVKRPPPETS